MGKKMSKTAEKTVKWGVYLCVMILIFACIRILRRGEIGSFSVFEREIGQYIQAALASGTILFWTAYLIDRTRENEG